MKNHFITNIEKQQKSHTNTCLILLISIIPFMVLEIMTHEPVFIEFAFLLFLLVLYTLKQIQKSNNILILINETKEKLQKTKIKKTYQEGSHIITNPDPKILNLGGYAYIGTDDYGTKLYQNITDVIVCGRINPIDGEIIYDDCGIPTYIISNINS